MEHGGKTGNTIQAGKKKINELLNKYSLNRENVKEAEHNSKRIKEMTAMYKFHSSRAEKYKNWNKKYAIGNKQHKK